MENENENKSNKVSLQHIDEYISKSKEIDENLKSFRLNDLDREDLPNNVTDEIRDKRQKITDLKREKQETIKKIIGQLYNGVIIPESLSIRKGEIYEYRCQYTPQLSSIKQKILKNLHEVNEKLSDENMEVLEFCLENVDESDDSYNFRYGRDRDNEDKNKSFEFDELKFVEIRDSDESQQEVKICSVNNIIVDDKGSVEFSYKYLSDDDDEREIKPNLNDNSESMLFQKFENEIRELAKDFIKELDEDIDNREEKLKVIKEKGSSQLMICEMVSTSDKIRGYN